MIEVYECAYCHQPIDPANPEAHISKCPKHPAYKYRVALEQLLEEVDEAAKKADSICELEIAELLLSAAARARQTLATGPHPNGEDRR